MTYNEVYKILFFKKTTLTTTKIIMFTKNNLIIVTDSAKQCGAQIFIHLM
jgi:hypothetical protein